jgi:hypothetical protein
VKRNNKEVTDDTKFALAVEKFSRAKRRSNQDKTKGNKRAEAKITELTEEVGRLSQRLKMSTTLLRWLVKHMPESVRTEYEVYRQAINAGDVNDVHPE